MNASILQNAILHSGVEISSFFLSQCVFFPLSPKGVFPQKVCLFPSRVIFHFCQALYLYIFQIGLGLQLCTWSFNILDIYIYIYIYIYINLLRLNNIYIYIYIYILIFWNSIFFGYSSNILTCNFSNQLCGYLILLIIFYCSIFHLFLLIIFLNLWDFPLFSISLVSNHVINLQTSYQSQE